MEDIIVPLTDERLRVRYQTLVKSHMHAATTVAAGSSAVHDGASALAVTQAAWRFFNNERVTLEAMACVTVWQLERQTSEPAQKMKKLLVRLSGRQMKRSRPVTASALLAGLFVLLPLLDLLASHGGDLSDIQRLAEQTLPMFFRRRDV